MFDTVINQNDQHIGHNNNSIHNRIQKFLGGLFVTFLGSVGIAAGAGRQAKRNALHNKINAIALFIKTCMKSSHLSNNDPVLALACAEHIQELLFAKNSLRTEHECLMNLLESNTFASPASLFSFQGKLGAVMNRFQNAKHLFAEAFVALGYIDALVATAKFYKNSTKTFPNKFCFAQYVKAETPALKLINCWHPALDPKIVVPNTLVLGGENNPQNVVITGPNAGGKSTILKAITLSILFAQTIGIVPAQECALTPFTTINTYMNIADKVGKQSLFQAEMNRAKRLLDEVGHLQPNEFAFTIQDEIFTGTNGKEGAAAAYGIITKLSSYKNSIGLFATHYELLTKLEEATQGVVVNKKVTVHKNQDGSFTYPYKLENGATDQTIALDLLAQQNFDADIVTIAQSVLHN